MARRLADAGRFEAVSWYGPFTEHPVDCGKTLLALGVSGAMVMEGGTVPAGAHLPCMGLKIAPILDPHPGLFFIREHLARQLPLFSADRENLAHRVRVPCWNNPAERRLFIDAMVARAGAYAPENLLWLTVANEGASTKQNTAFDFCSCDFCAKAYREWLTLKSGRDASDRFCPTTDELRADMAGRFDAWHNYRCFVDEGFYNALSEVCVELRKRHPDVPLSLNGLWPPGPFGSQNWDRIPELFDILESYDECGELELARSFCEGKADLAFTFPVVSVEDRRFWEHSFWNFFIHGARAVVVEKFSRLLNVKGGFSVTEGGLALSKLLEPVKSLLAPALAGFERDDDPILVLYSPRSHARAYMDTVFSDGWEWACRSVDWVHNEEPYLSALESCYRLIEDAGRQFKVVSERTGLDDSPGKGRLLVLPLPAALTAGERAWVGRFAATGGAVVHGHSLRWLKGRTLLLPPDTENYRSARLQTMDILPGLAAFRNFADSALPEPLVRIVSERNERVEITTFRKGAERIISFQRNDVRRFFDVSPVSSVPVVSKLNIKCGAAFVKDLFPNDCCMKEKSGFSVKLPESQPVFCLFSLRYD